jgi:succinate dehydrogenase/fumarate reductase flavoprotein subunit
VTPPEPAPTTPDRARLAEIAAVRERFHELLEDENPHHPWAIRYREKQQMGATVDLERAERMADWAWDTNQDDLARTLDDLLAALRAAEAGRERLRETAETLLRAEEATRGGHPCGCLYCAMFRAALGDDQP